MQTEASNTALIDNCLMCTVYFVCFVTPSTIFCYIILILLTFEIAVLHICSCALCAA